METLPSGVTLRDFYDPQTTRSEIFRRVQEAYHQKFEKLENDRVKLELVKSGYDPKKQKYSLDQYQDAVLKGGRMSTPLTGTVRLVDKASGKPLDEKEVVLANVPYFTDDGTFVIGGNHYTTNNQSRLKAGVYARRKENGELESHINVKPGTGTGMRLFMEPDTGIYRVSVNQANIKLYPVLKGLGIKDEEIAKSWGPDILQANRNAWDSRAFGKFYTKLVGNRANPQADEHEQRKAIHESLARMEFDPEVNSRTLGKPHANNGVPVLLDASAKLLRINRKEDTEDDRDHPANRSFHTVDDFLVDRIQKDAGQTARNLLYKATYDRTLKHLRPGHFTDQLEGLIVGNSLSSPIPGINPIEIFDQQKRVVQLGEGGISSLEAVPMSSRNVHPGQLGLIDPIRSAESSAVGVDQRFAIGAKKGSDNNIYIPLKNRKSGKIEYLNPTQLHGKVIAFPQSHSLERFKSKAPMQPMGSVVAPEPLPGPAQGPAEGSAENPSLGGVTPTAGALTPEIKPAGTPAQGPAGLKTANLDSLREAKRYSDMGNYAQKTRILRELMAANPEEWYRDSEHEGSTGLTHRNTGWQFHLPTEQVPVNIKLGHNLEFGQHYVSFEELADVGFEREETAADLLNLPKTASKAVDLDGTLAFLPEGKGIPFIGKPIKPMMDRVRRWLDQGEEVIIFTARAHDPKNIPAIRAWLRKHNLPPLKITNQKTPDIEEIWDDRAHRVARNKGHLLSKEADLAEVPAADLLNLPSTPKAQKLTAPAAPPKRPDDPTYMAGYRQSLGRSSHTRPVAAMRNGKMTLVHPDEPEYEIPSGAHMFTETSNLVPISSTMKGARLFISSKYFTQALPLQNPEAAYVDTHDADNDQPYSKTIGTKLGTVTSRINGRVRSMSDKHIDIEGEDGKIERHELKHFFPHNRKTFTTHLPRVNVGDTVSAGGIIARSNYTDRDGHLALGKNLAVAFMPAPGGATFEDSITVSESAAKHLTSQHLYGFDVEHKGGVDSNKKRFISLFPNKYTNEQLAKIDENGMVKPGVHLEPGDPMFLSFSPRTLSSKDAALGNLHKVLKNSFEDRSQVWEKSTPGRVAHAVQTRNGLSVNVSTHMPLQTGDKISARQGAKGVIGKIVPDDQMVRRADGTPMDVIVNPAAIIGRVNPGMIFEALLGKVAHKTGKRYALPAFSQESIRDFVEHELKTHGESDKEDLFNPATGRKAPGVLTGRQYFMKLEHTSDSKVSGRGEGGMDLNEQPTKGGSEGAKRLGGLQVMALLSHGATDVLRDAHIYRGTKNEDLWRRIRLGQPLPPPKVPFIFDKFLNSLKAAGINVKKDGHKINIMAMTDKDVDQLAKNELQSSDTLDPKTGEPIKGGLMDFALHGGPTGTGWSHIKLDHPMPNPVMEEPIRRLLGLTQNKFRDVLAGKAPLGSKTGPDAFVEALSNLNLDQMEEDARETIRSGRKTKRDEAVKQLHFITGLKKSKLSPADMLITKVPVLPPTYRPVSFVNGMAMSADANYLYKDLMTARDAYRHNKAELPEDHLGDERLGVYDAVKAVQGLGDPINAESAQKGIKGFVRQIAGVGGPKTGMFMSKVIGHPVNTVGRSVIIPDADLNMDEVGVPEKMAWKMFSPFVMRRMVRAGMPAMMAARHVEDKTNVAKEHLIKEMEHRPILYSRDPALHRFSIMGAFGKLRPGNNIAISPLVVKPFGADHDGDQMNVHVPISDDAVEEIKKKMLPSQNLFSLKDKKAHYVPSQEFVLGLFNGTKPHPKKQPVIFPSKEEAKAAYDRKEIDIDTPIEIVEKRVA